MTVIPFLHVKDALHYTSFYCKKILVFKEKEL